MRQFTYEVWIVLSKALSVLSHIGNIFGAIPIIGHSLHQKEKYEGIQIVLVLLKDEEHK